MDSDDDVLDCKLEQEMPFLPSLLRENTLRMNAKSLFASYFKEYSRTRCFPRLVVTLKQNLKGEHNMTHNETANGMEEISRDEGWDTRKKWQERNERK